MSAEGTIARILAAAWACTSAVGLYPLVRIAQALLTREPHPASVLFSDHAGFYWRVLLVVFAGALLAFPAHLIATRDPARVARALTWAVPLVAALLAVQAAIAP